MYGILTVFFRENREEIVEMGVYEFDQELHDKILLEDGKAIGIEKGIEIGILQSIKSLMETLKLTEEQAMEALKIPDAERTKFRERL